MKRKCFFAAALCLMLAVSLLSAPAMADKGKEPVGKGKVASSRSAAYEAGFELGQNAARITAIVLAVVAVGGVVAGVAGRNSHRGSQGVATPLHRAYYRPAAKGENCGRMPEAPEEPAPWVPEESPVWQAETPSSWPLSPEREAPSVPMEEPAPVHPTMEENPFAAFEDFFGSYSVDESSWEEEHPEEPGDDEPGDVYFKI